MALWGLLCFARKLLLESLWTIGDSKVLIDYVNQKVTINVNSIIQWMERIKTLKESFEEISFHHVYREKNIVANQLSKEGLDVRYGVMFYQFTSLEHLEPFHLHNWGFFCLTYLCLCYCFYLLLLFVISAEVSRVGAPFLVCYVVEDNIPFPRTRIFSFINDVDP